MRDIEGIEEAVQELSHYWPEILSHFNAENEKYKQLFRQDHQNIGRILKCHLIIEKYLNDYIEYHNNISNLSDLRLTFYQKANMLPKTGSSASIVKPGILQINNVRNKFGHNLNTLVSDNDISSVDLLLQSARPELMRCDPITRIEGFTTVACTWLMNTPPDLEEAYQRAFSKISIAETRE